MKGQRAAVRLAMACALRYWSAGAQRDGEDEEGDEHFDRAEELLRGVDTRRAVRLLADAGKAGTEARHSAVTALRREGLPVQGYGVVALGRS